jgi:electron transport complex protein RnfC
MRAKTFRGGVHVPENKHWTSEKSIEVMPLPRRVIIPLLQHTGAPCEPLVKEGDEVKAGQKIGEAKSFISAPVHASISGKVKAIGPMPHPVVPSQVASVVIESEGEPSGGEWLEAARWEDLDKEEIKAKIREAGIVGLGGAAFPTHVKLSPPPEKTIDTLIINGVECEPYLTNDHRMMMERWREIIEGTKIFLKILGVKRVFIGIEQNKPDAIKLMREKLAEGLNGAGTGSFKGTGAGNGARMEVVPLRIKYPQGAEKQLIKAILNREVPSGGLPFDVGVVVQNVGTAFAVYEAVVKGKPLIERVLTVSGDAVKEPKNVLVRIGTPFADVIEYCGGLPAEGDYKVIMGGPLMGLAQYTLEAPVIKGTSGILVIRKAVSREKGDFCIKCGRCVDACPVYLMPYRIGDYAEKDNFAMADKFGVKDCIECGCCAYVCETGRPLIQLFKYAKVNLRAKK